MIRVRMVFLAIMALMFSVQTAMADQVKTFAVLPFAVNGPEKFAYLSQGMQDMLMTRLSWPGKFQPMDKGAIDQKVKTAPRAESEAKAAMTALKADYVIFGSMTVSGDDVSLDVKVMDANGRVVPKTSQAKVNTLIPAMEDVAKSINSQVFKRPEASVDPRTGKPEEPVNQMNPSLVVNQVNADQPVYLNPNFRYAGNSDMPGTWRSQTMPFAANGMAIGDLEGNGKNVVAIITASSEIHVYRWQDRQLAEIAKYELSKRLTLVRASIVPVGADKPRLVVSGFTDKLPQSYIFRLDGNKLVPEAQRESWYLAAVKLPPRFLPQLVGSRGDRRNVFTGGVYEMSFTNGKLTSSVRMSLPEKANPFNFAFLPEESGYKLVFVDDNDHLNVVSGKNDVIAKTEEQYAGSSVGVEHDSLMPPTAQPNENDYLWSHYYIPLPLVPVVLGKMPQLLVSRNISIASQFFENFRSFSQGEIHSLAWDGVGLNLKWKTRRIKGTIVGYDVADLENQGTQSLVVCLNTFPGVSGFGSRRALLMAYPLDLNTAQQKGQFSNMDGGSE